MNISGAAMGLGDHGVFHPDPARRQQNRRIRESELASLGAAGTAAERSYAIARLKRSEKLDECLATMRKRRSSILESMSQNWLFRRWHEQLDGIDLTAIGAEDQLRPLVREVQRTKDLYAGDIPRFDPPQWWANVTGSSSLASAPAPSPAASEDWDELWTRTPLGAELRAKEDARKAAMEQAAAELGSLESSLDVLVSDVRQYAHYRDLPLETYLSM
jgi:hypothetical protein